MKFVIRMSVTVGIVILLLLWSMESTVFAQKLPSCAILIVGQSLGKGIYDRRDGIAEVIDNVDFKRKSNCQSIDFVDGATGGSAAECAISQKANEEPAKCWINHSPTYNGGKKIGGALDYALSKIGTTMNNSIPTKRKKILALIWSQGERDSSYITKPFPELITDPSNLCGFPKIYCKEAYKQDVNEIFMELRKSIVTYSKANFGSQINNEDIPIFVHAIGRRAISSTVSSSSISDWDKRVQTIREAQYEIIEDGVNVSIAALGYDQPLGEILSSDTSNPHPTPDGYFEIAKRLGFAIQSYFNGSHIPAYYTGPQVVGVSWENWDIIATIAHSTKTSTPDTPKCTAPTYCGFQVSDGVTSFKIEVSKNGSPKTVNGLKQTQYRLKILDRPSNLDINRIRLTFAFGAMSEINVPRTVNDATTNNPETINEARNIVTQKCLSTASPDECTRPENLTLPIQPAFFISQGGKFSNMLNKFLLVLPKTQ